MEKKDKEKALTQIISLMNEYELSIDEISAKFIKEASHDKKKSASLIMRLLTYIGALFIFSGIGFFVAILWESLNSLARVIIIFGPGLIALIMAIAVIKDERYKKAFTPLLLIAAFMQPGGLFVFLGEYFDGNDASLASMIVFGPLALQMGLIFKALKQTSSLFFMLTYGLAFLWALMDTLEIDEELIATTLGLSGTLITYAINKTPYRAFTPFTFFIFALLLSGGLFSILDTPPFDMLLIGVAAFMIYLSVMAQSRSLLVASVITMLGYLGYYTNEYFADMLSWPVALIIMGMVMLGISSYAVKLSYKISEN
jgi:uncharacterized membrane protein